MTERPTESLSDGVIVARRTAVSDAPAIREAVAPSADHLRPWMAWARDAPEPLEHFTALLGEWRKAWDDGREFPYLIEGADGVVLGACGLHRRVGVDGLEIGYWVRVDRIGEGLAPRAARLLVDAAFELDGVDAVEIHHDRANVRSRRVPEKLGFELVGEFPDETGAPAEQGIECRWRLRRADPARPGARSAR